LTLHAESGRIAGISSRARIIVKRTLFVIILIFLGSFLFNTEARAQEQPPGKAAAAKPEPFPPLPPADFSALRQVAGGRVAQVIDAVHLRLEDNRIIQLAATEVPGMDPYAPADSAFAARDFLRLLAGKQQIRLYETKNASRGRVNRMGFELAQVEVAGLDGKWVWVQGALLQRGFARIRPDGDNAEMAAQMLALENKARARKAGLWRAPETAALTAENATRGAGALGIVEGTVRTSAAVDNTLYLNFGDDWRQDFTVALSPEVRRQFAHANIDPLQFSGKRLRVHGWIESHNGPLVKLSDMAWLEILPEAPEAAKN
jgi:endonuclease YncB( thermonuclease family)